MVELLSHADGTIVSVRAQPGARRQGVVGEHDGALCVAISAVPDKGKANRALTAVLSKEFGISKNAVELISGTISRQKRFLLHGISSENATTIVIRLLNLK